MRATRKFSLIVSIVILGSVLSMFVARGDATSSLSSIVLSRDELANQIQAKAKQLDDLNAQIEATKKNLQGVQGERKTLQTELTTLQNTVNQLNLSIRSDEVSIQKLNLEINSLSLDIKDIASSIQDKKSAIETAVVELQKNDRIDSNLLMIFLKNASLADGALEAQTLDDLQTQLTTDIQNLNALHRQYDQKITEASSKKIDVASHKQNLTNKAAIVQDQKQEQENLLVVTKDKESNFQKQLADLQKLQQQVAQEVETLDAVLRTKIDPSILPPLGPGVLAIPVQGDDKNDVTQGYGATAFAKNGYQGHWHNGVDFAASVGTPVLAAEDGTIVATGNQDSYCYKGAYGKFIVIKHNDSLVTLYGHLSRQIVQKGDIVKRGEVIGYSGKTGYATGPHLHFTVYAGPTFYMGPSKVCGPMPFGGDLNPLGYL